MQARPRRGQGGQGQKILGVTFYGGKIKIYFIFNYVRVQAPADALDT